MHYVAALAMCMTFQGNSSCDLMPQPFYSLQECTAMRDVYRGRRGPMGSEYFCVIRNAQGALERAPE